MKFWRLDRWRKSTHAADIARMEPGLGEPAFRGKGKVEWLNHPPAVKKHFVFIDLSDAPLICDEPPGRRLISITYTGCLTEAKVKALKQAQRAHDVGLPVNLDGGMILYQTAEPGQWPDAEFCAA